MPEAIMTRVLRTPEWIVHNVDCPVGSELHSMGVSLRGFVTEVPTDPAERALFKSRFDYHPTTDPDANVVLVTVIIPIIKVGSKGRNKMANGDWSPEFVSDRTKVYSAHPAHYAELQDAVYQTHTEPSGFWCVAPREAMLLWERKALNMLAASTDFILSKTATRHRLVVCEGTLSVDGVDHTGPKVIPVVGGEEIMAVTDIYGTEVWV